MGILNKDELRKRGQGTPARFEDVTLHDGSLVRVYAPSRAEQREWRRATDKKNGQVDMEKLQFSNDVLLSICLRDSDGQRVFTTDEALRGIFDEWDSADIGELMDVIVRLMGVVKKSDIEGAIKNSGETLGSDSSGVSSETAAA